LHCDGFGYDVYYPENLSELKYVFDSESEIHSNFFPKRLKTLDIVDYEFELKCNDLPPNLISLTLQYYDYKIKPGILPKNLKKLNLFGFKNGKRIDIKIKKIKMSSPKFINCNLDS